MANFTFEVEERKEFGKGFARRARAAGKIPAVIYSHGGVPEHITLPMHETTQAVRTQNALFEVKLAGKEHLALVKDIQRDFVTRVIEHIDLQEVKAGEIVDVHVAFKLVGEPVPGNFAATSFKTLAVKVDATKIPSVIELDITDATEGNHFRISDVNFPEGVTPDLKADTIVVAIKARAKQKVEEDSASPVESEAEAPAEESAE